MTDTLARTLALGWLIALAVFLGAVIAELVA